ncbi:hypothetical protein AB6T85_23350, partial [Erwinia sp. ACCC 02193]
WRLTTPNFRKIARSLHSTAKGLFIRIYPQSYPHPAVRTNLDEHHANVFATMPRKNPGPHLGALPESSLLLSL